MDTDPVTKIEIYALSCARDEAECKSMGNFVTYSKGKDGNHNFLYLERVDATRCEPKPEQCHCKPLVENVLERNSKIDRIDLYLDPKPFMAGCRCYLGVAASKGFTFIESKKKKLGKYEFTTDNYVEICEAMKKKKFKGDASIYKPLQD